MTNNVKLAVSLIMSGQTVSFDMEASDEYIKGDKETRNTMLSEMVGAFMNDYKAMTFATLTMGYIKLKPNEISFISIYEVAMPDVKDSKGDASGWAGAY